MVTILSVLVGILLVFVVGTASLVRRLQQEIIELSKEQHIQNKDILRLLKYEAESTSTLIQHTEILQYLVDRDPLLSKTKIIYTGPVGEA